MLYIFIAVITLTNKGECDVTFFDFRYYALFCKFQTAQLLLSHSTEKSRETEISLPKMMLQGWLGGGQDQEFPRTKNIDKNV